VTRKFDRRLLASVACGTLLSHSSPDTYGPARLLASGSACHRRKRRRVVAPAAARVPSFRLVGETGQRDFFASLPRKRLAAGALITDSGGRVLLVQPTYKESWEVPGGIVEGMETASAGCARELREELGLELAVGRLLVIEHQTDGGIKGDSLMFVYDGGSLSDITQIRLDREELKDCRFVQREDLAALTTAKLARRLGHAIDARAEGILIELENGVRRL